MLVYHRKHFGVNGHGAENDSLGDFIIIKSLVKYTVSVSVNRCCFKVFDNLI